MRQRSSHRLKEYSSCTDLRSWSMDEEEQRRWFLEVAATAQQKTTTSKNTIGRFVPPQTVFDLLLEPYKSELERYRSLPLTDEQAKMLDDMKGDRITKDVTKSDSHLDKKRDELRSPKLKKDSSKKLDKPASTKLSSLTQDQHVIPKEEETKRVVEPRILEPDDEDVEGGKIKEAIEDVEEEKSKEAIEDGEMEKIQEVTEDVEVDKIKEATEDVGEDKIKEAIEEIQKVTEDVEVDKIKEATEDVGEDKIKEAREKEEIEIYIPDETEVEKEEYLDFEDEYVEEEEDYDKEDKKDYIENEIDEKEKGIEYEYDDKEAKKKHEIEDEDQGDSDEDQMISAKGSVLSLQEESEKTIEDILQEKDEFLALCQCKIKDSEETCDELRYRVDLLEAETTQYKKYLTEMESFQEDLMKKCEKLAEELDQSKKEQDILSENLKQVEGERDLLNQNLEKAASKQNDKENEVLQVGDQANLEGRLQALAREGDLLRDKAEELSSLAIAYKNLESKLEACDAIKEERDLLRMKLRDYMEREPEIEMLKYRGIEAEALRIECQNLKKQLAELTGVDIALRRAQERNLTLEKAALEKESELRALLAEMREKRDSLQGQHDQLNDQIKSLLAEAERLREENINIQAQADQIVSDLRHDLEEREYKIKEMREQLNILPSQKSIECLCEQSDQMMAQLKMMLERSRQENEELQDKLQYEMSTNEQLRSELETRPTKEDATCFEDCLAKLQTEQSELNDTLAKLLENQSPTEDTNLLELQLKLKDAMIQTDGANKQIDEIMKERDELAENLRKCSEEMSDLEQKIRSLQEINNRYQDQLAEQDNKYRKAEMEKENLNNTLNLLEKEKTELMCKCKEYERYDEELQIHQTELSDHIDTIVHELSSERDKSLIAAHEMEEMRSSILEQQALIDAAEKFRTHDQERLVEIEAALKKCEEEKATYLAKIEDLENTLKEEKEFGLELQHRLSTEQESTPMLMDHEPLKDEATLLPSPKMSRHSSILSIDNEDKALKEENTLLVACLFALESLPARTILELERRIEAYRKTSEQLQNELETFQNNLNKVNDLYKSCTEKNKDLYDENTKLKNLIRNLESDLNDNRQSHQNNLEKSFTENMMLKTEMEELQKNYCHMEEKCKCLEKQCECSQNMANYLGKCVSDMSDLISRQNEKLQDLTEEKLQREQDLANAVSSSVESQDHAVLMENLSQELQNMIQKLEEELKECRNANEQLSQREKNLEKQLAEKVAENESLTARTINLENTNSEVELLNEKLRNCEESNKELHDKLRNCEESNKDLHDKLRNSEKSSKELHEKLKNLERESSLLKESLSIDSEELKAMKEINDIMKQEYQDASKEYGGREETLKQQLKTLEKEKMETTKLMQAKESELNSCKEANESLKKALENMKKGISGYENEQAERERLQSEILKGMQAKDLELNSCKEENERLNKALENMKKTILDYENGQAERERLQSEILKGQKENKTLLDTIKRLEHELSLMQDKIKSAKLIPSEYGKVAEKDVKSESEKDVKSEPEKDVKSESEDLQSLLDTNIHKNELQAQEIKNLTEEVNAMREKANDFEKEKAELLKELEKLRKTDSAELFKEIQMKDENLNNLQKELDALKRENSDFMNKLQEVMKEKNECRDELEALNKRLEVEVALHVDNETKNFNEVNERCKTELDKLRDDYERKIQDLQNSHMTEIKKLNQSCQDALANAKSLFEKDKKALREEHSKNIERLRKVHDKEISHLKKQSKVHAKDSESLSSESEELEKKDVHDDMQGHAQKLEEPRDDVPDDMIRRIAKKILRSGFEELTLSELAVLHQHTISATSLIVSREEDIFQCLCTSRTPLLPQLYSTKTSLSSKMRKMQEKLNRQDEELKERKQEMEEEIRTKQAEITKLRETLETKRKQNEELQHKISVQADSINDLQTQKDIMVQRSVSNEKELKNLKDKLQAEYKKYEQLESEIAKEKAKVRNLEKMLTFTPKSLKDSHRQDPNKWREAFQRSPKCVCPAHKLHKSNPQVHDQAVKIYDTLDLPQKAEFPNPQNRGKWMKY